MKNFQHKLLLVLFLFIGLNACKTNSDPIPAPNKYLVSATSVIDYSKDALVKALLQQFGSDMAILGLLVNNGVKVYKIVYKTTGLNGESLNASGVFFAPNTVTTSTSLACYSHGTITAETDAPSHVNLNSEAAFGLFFAGTGFFMAMPDYLGYGESKAYPHPYQNRKGLAQDNVNFLLAIKEYIAQEKLNWNKKLLLTGYSEGGYANLATQKLLEENYPTEFNIAVSSCGAGAYNTTATVKTFLQTSVNTDSEKNKSYLWVLLTYDRIYNIKRSLSDYFVEPYLSQITKDGYNAVISTSFNKILTEKFKSGIMDGTDTQWINALKDNDIYDWKPTTPTYLYHGTADDYVPYLNSQTAFNAMKAKGAANVFLMPITDGTHSSSLLTFFQGTFDLFNKNKN